MQPYTKRIWVKYCGGTTSPEWVCVLIRYYITTTGEIVFV